MSKRDILIGGAWPYANYYLHIGHFAALLPGDVLARYFRGKGDNVMYVSGSDCHGTPITERAKKEGKTPKEIAEFYHNEFVKSFKAAGFEYDLYLATMYDVHKEYVMDFFKKMYDNGYIYEKEVQQDYCEKCKTFLSDREIVGTCPHCGGESTGDQCEACGSSLNSTEVLNKHCKACGSETVTRKNKHLYFKLPVFQKELQQLIDDNKNRWRKNAVGEAQKFINLGLVERAATRQLDWGVPVPIPGYEDKRVYVWIEAVLGYLSMANKVCLDRGLDPDKVLSKDNPNIKSYYVHGKDNIPFHTTIYPALIMAAKVNYNLPDYIVSSAYVNLNDEKMSKSKGNLITVNELLEKFDSDTIRFYFTFKGPETNDMSCSMEDIVTTHNKFLVGMLGNFVNRNLSFINKKFDGIIKESKIDKDIIKETKKCFLEAGEYFEKAELRNAVERIIEYISLANKYYDSREPWIQAKEDIDGFNETTYTCVYMMANMANLIAPIMTHASDKIKHMLSLPEYVWEETTIKGDIKIKDLAIIYDRLDEKDFS